LGGLAQFPFNRILRFDLDMLHTQYISAGSLYLVHELVKILLFFGFQFEVPGMIALAEDSLAQGPH
jgi:apolipoprotein N-acyltransferase